MGPRKWKAVADGVPAAAESESCDVRNEPFCGAVVVATLRDVNSMDELMMNVQCCGLYYNSKYNRESKEIATDDNSTRKQSVASSHRRSRKNKK